MDKCEFERRIAVNREMRGRLGDPYGIYSDELERLCLEYIGQLEQQISEHRNG